MASEAYTVRRADIPVCRKNKEGGHSCLPKNQTGGQTFLSAPSPVFVLNGEHDQDAELDAAVMRWMSVSAVVNCCKGRQECLPS